VVLYKPQAALRLHLPEAVNRRQPAGDNPPPGAIVDYYLKSKPEGEITLDILDARGNLVRHHSDREKTTGGEQPPEWPDQEKPAEIIPADAGMNRFAWDLRYESPVKVPGAFYAGIGPRGPLVLPGTYTVRLTVAGKSYTAPLEVKLDPRVKIFAADLQKQFDLAMKIQERIVQMHDAINQIRNLRSQLVTLKKWAGDTAPAKAIAAATDRVEKEMAPVEGLLMQVKMKSSEGNLRYPNMLNEQFDTFRASVQGADAAPTQQQLEVFNGLSRRLDEQLAKWKEISAREVPALNELMKREGVPALNITIQAGDQ
jgi:hypothetical protein